LQINSEVYQDLTVLYLVLAKELNLLKLFSVEEPRSEVDKSHFDHIRLVHGLVLPITNRGCSACLHEDQSLLSAITGISQITYSPRTLL